MKVIALIGESCVGKSTLAEALRVDLNAKVYAGKDYVRLARSEPEARRVFAALLAGAAEPVIYVVSEEDQLALLPDDCVRVLLTAPLEVKKERFAKRMGGKLPPPVCAMLEKKHGAFDGIRCDVRLEFGNYDPQTARGEIARFLA
jgi:nicotinamide riboside kinase